MQAKGRAFKYGDNVDTDVIIPVHKYNRLLHLLQLLPGLPGKPQTLHVPYVLQSCG